MLSNFPPQAKPPHLHLTIPVIKSNDYVKHSEISMIHQSSIVAIALQNFFIKVRLKSISSLIAKGDK